MFVAPMLASQLIYALTRGKPTAERDDASTLGTLKSPSPGEREPAR